MKLYFLWKIQSHGKVNQVAAHTLKDFPTTGIMQFYIEDTDPYGLDEACVVRFLDNYIKDEDCLIKENPYRENYQEYEPFNHNGKITFKQRCMPITSSSEKFEELLINDIADEERNALYVMRYFYS